MVMRASDKRILFAIFSFFLSLFFSLSLSFSLFRSPNETEEKSQDLYLPMIGNIYHMSLFIDK